MWVDRAGRATPVPGFPEYPAQPRISPDGTRALFDAPSPDGDDEIFLADLCTALLVPEPVPASPLDFHVLLNWPARAASR